MKKYVSCAFLLFAGCGIVTPGDPGDAVGPANDVADDQIGRPDPPFNPDLFHLEVNSIGSGSVIPQTGTYPRGRITLNATPDLGWRFDHWEGAVTGTSTNATFLLGEDQTVTAVFVDQPVWVALRVAVIGQGSVALSPRGAPDGDAWLYLAGTEVRLIAVPDEGFVFEGWEGAASSTNPSTFLTVNSDSLAIARFGTPPFEAGDVFSFLSIQETELFLLLVAEANNEITQWYQDELHAIALDRANRGFSSGGSIARQLVCEAEEQAVEMRRAATWLVLDDPLGLSFQTLIFLGVTNEVDDWNCRRYPDPSCSVVRTCR